MRARRSARVSLVWGFSWLSNAIAHSRRVPFRSLGNRDPKRELGSMRGHPGLTVPKAHPDWNTIRKGQCPLHFLPNDR